MFHGEQPAGAARRAIISKTLKQRRTHHESAGSRGTAAIFTDRERAAHVMRKVLLRQIAITNYVNPF